jgi:hypothetical protein
MKKMSLFFSNNNSQGVKEEIQEDRGGTRNFLLRGINARIFCFGGGSPIFIS